MKRHLFTLLTVLVFSAIETSFCQTTSSSQIIPQGAEVIKLAGNFAFTEGPAADKHGNVYFTDQPNDRIMIWTLKGELITFMQPAGRSNGLFFDKDGNLWACADEKNELWKITPDKKIEVVVNKYNDAPFNGPNDLWISNDGKVYFTDPFYLRSWWDHTQRPQDKQCVYYLSPDHKTLIRVIDDLLQPNGIVGTPDGKTLYVADIGDRKTWCYKINPDGSVTDKKLFCNMGSDGMTIDNKGNIYLTGNGVTVFDKTGKQIVNIPVPEKWTANVCFGGKNRKTLFITASTGLYSIQTKVKGVY
ncbi:MAG: SMP-30/gluconolactonase/LRE family protein [Bacteroidales bacterium]|nr:SMP-30/gluconolactonase/LRE family protein [Bacteroidales bacterium]